MTKLISKYMIAEGYIFVEAPYCQHIVDTCRSWGGRYFSSQGWRLPLARLEEVQSLLGYSQDDLVEIEVGMDQVEGDQQLRVGWYVLANRKQRDYQVDIFADLVSGSVPSSGGSVKSPAVNPSEDSRFRLYVCRDFALVRNLTIVTDPKIKSPTNPRDEALATVKFLVEKHNIKFAELSLL